MRSLRLVLYFIFDLQQMVINDLDRSVDVTPADSIDDGLVFVVAASILRLITKMGEDDQGSAADYVVEIGFKHAVARHAREFTVKINR